MECGLYVAYNNEKGGVIENLKEDGIVDLDSKLPNHSFSEWLSTKAMVSTWLADATSYELWVGSDGSVADKIYFSNLPWLIGKVLHWKQAEAVKQRLGITKLNGEARASEVFFIFFLYYNHLLNLVWASLFVGDPILGGHAFPRFCAFQCLVIVWNESLYPHFLFICIYRPAFPYFDPNFQINPHFLRLKQGNTGLSTQPCSLVSMFPFCSMHILRKK